MASGTSSTHAVIHWNTLKGSISVIVFLILAVVAEIIIVLYSMALGVTDVGELTTNWPVTITISPLFQLVPVAVIITLLFTWIYLTRQLSFRPVQQIGKPDVRQQYRKGQPTKREIEKTKPSSETSRHPMSTWQKMGFNRATIKSALIVFIAFAVLILVISQLVYPGALYQAATGAYQGRSVMYGFVTSVAKALADFAHAVAPVGWLANAINNALIAIAPGVRAVGLALGGLIAPLANLDAAGKYLAFQNGAAWISVLLVLLYTYYPRRSYRYRKK